MEQGRDCEAGSAYQGSISFLLGWLLACVMSIADLALTLRLHAHDALDELNPVANGLFAIAPVYVVFLKICSIIVFSVALWRLAFKSYNTAVKVLVVVNVILGLVIIQHIRILMM